MMTAVLVDTDVVSFLLKLDSRAAQYRRHLDGRALAISFMTLAELDRWGLQRAWGPRRQAALTALLEDFVVHWPDRDLCRQWARVSAQARRSGRPIETADAWIAATAIQFGLALVTHNASDYEAVEGLELVSLG